MPQPTLPQRIAPLPVASDQSAPPLIGLAHGSRDPRAASAIRDLMTAVADLRPGLATSVAFLDLAPPDLATAVGGLAEQAVPRAVVVPLLFAQAFHAKVDVPDAVSSAATQSGVDLRTADILGLGSPVLAALRFRADAAGVRPEQPILLLAVGTSEPGANQVVHDFADRWSSLRPGLVRAVFATADPLARDALDRSWSQPPAVIPLFLAPGLLLDQVRRRAAARGVLVTEPLGTLMAQLVLDRYDAAVA